MSWLAARLGFIALALALAAAPARADDDETPFLGDIECDPFPFATGRYGCQLGVRPPALHGLRISVAQFSVDVPDVIAQLGGNDGFHVDVRPGSGALYVLYYVKAPFEDGLTVGASLRYLRFRYTHDDEPGVRTSVTELSPEAIVGYQWHPFHNGFYIQPWLALGVAAYHSRDAVVGTHEYDEMPVSVFATVNVGYERAF
jgi:hypothetical protein